MIKRILWAHLLFNNMTLCVRLGRRLQGTRQSQKAIWVCAKIHIRYWVAWTRKTAVWVMRGSRFLGIFVVKSSRSYWHRAVGCGVLKKASRAIPRFGAWAKWGVDLLWTEIKTPRKSEIRGSKRERSSMFDCVQFQMLSVEHGETLEILENGLFSENTHEPALAEYMTLQPVFCLFAYLFFKLNTFWVKSPSLSSKLFPELFFMFWWRVKLNMNFPPLPLWDNGIHFSISLTPTAATTKFYLFESSWLACIPHPSLDLKSVLVSVVTCSEKLFINF